MQIIENLKAVTDQGNIVWSKMGQQNLQLKRIYEGKLYLKNRQ